MHLLTYWLKLKMRWSSFLPEFQIVGEQCFLSGDILFPTSPTPPTHFSCRSLRHCTRHDWIEPLCDFSEVTKPRLLWWAGKWDEPQWNLKNNNNKKRQGELSGTPSFVGGWFSGLAASDMLCCPHCADTIKCERGINQYNCRRLFGSSLMFRLLQSQN